MSKPKERIIDKDGRIIAANNKFTKKYVESIASQWCRLNIETVEDAIQGAKDIIAEEISDDADYRKAIKKIYYKFGTLESSANKDEKSAYDMYYSFSEGSMGL